MTLDNPKEIIEDGLVSLDLDNKRILLIIPDTTRTAPVGALVKIIHKLLYGKVKKLDIIIQETTRLESMVGEMLDFGKPMKLQLTDTNLNELVLDSIKVATGTLIYADNKFICYGMNGEVSLIQNNQNKLEITGSFKVKEGTGHHFAHPLVKDGVLYIRHGDALLAYEIK